MASGNVQYLERHLPAPRSELPFEPSTADTMAGLHSFTLRGGHGDSAPMGGRVTPVYYIDAHDREAVVRAFLDANPALVDAKPRRGLLRILGGHGRSWRTAARAVIGEYYNGEAESTNPDGFQGGKRTCWLCGETVAINKYPHHLATDCENTG